MAETKKTESAPAAESAPTERARYLVTQGPGAYIHGVGFVQPGESFAAPDDYVPSYTMRPMNRPAQVALEKLKKRIVEVRNERKESPGQVKHEDLVDTTIAAPKAAEPTVRKEEVSLETLRREGGERAADR